MQSHCQKDFASRAGRCCLCRLQPERGYKKYRVVGQKRRSDQIREGFTEVGFEILQGFRGGPRSKPSEYTHCVPRGMPIAWHIEEVGAS